MGKKAATEAPRWKNQIVGWDNVDPAQLLAHPGNFRRHPAAQRDALRGSLNELNIITPVIVNRLTGHLLDGHARVEEYLSAGISEVPVAYVEVPPEKESLALLSLDPIAAMAEADKEALDALLRDVATGEAGLQAMLAELAAAADMEVAGAGGREKRAPGYIIQYNLVFEDEDQQDTWFAFLRMLNLQYPDAPTIAARLTAYLTENALHG